MGVAAFSVYEISISMTLDLLHKLSIVQLQNLLVVLTSVTLHVHFLPRLAYRWYLLLQLR